MLDAIKVLTLNIGMLPGSVESVQKSFLKDSKIRAHQIVEHVLGMDPALQPDVICFQESFNTIANFALENLRSKYIHKTIPEGDLVNNQGGLSVYSKWPILEKYFKEFGNAMLGEETFAKKGFLRVKIQLADNPSKYFYVYNTHLHAGGAVLKQASIKHGGTTGSRRGMQMGMIALDIESLGDDLNKVPVFLAGDFNTHLNSERQWLSKSTGRNPKRFSSPDGHSKPDERFTRDGIKYEGQQRLMSQMYFKLPGNFVHVVEEYAENQMPADGSIPAGTPDTRMYTHKKMKVKIFKKILNSTEFYPGTSIGDRDLFDPTFIDDKTILYYHDSDENYRKFFINNGLYSADWLRANMASDRIAVPKAKNIKPASLIDVLAVTKNTPGKENFRSMIYSGFGNATDHLALIGQLVLTPGPVNPASDPFDFTQRKNDLGLVAAAQ